MKNKIKTIVDRHYVELSREEFNERIFNLFEEDITAESETQIHHMMVYGERDIFDLWRSEPDLYYNLSFKTVLGPFGCYYDPSEFRKKEIVNSIMERLKKSIEDEQQLYKYHIQLFNIRKIKQKIKIGDFEILPKDAFIDSFTSEEAKIWRSKTTAEDAIFWYCNLKVSEKYRGLELIEEYIKLFTNSIRVLYMDADPKRSIDFLNGSNQSMREVVIINQDGLPSGPCKRDIVLKIVDLQDKILKEFDPIWDKLFRIRTQKSEIFERIRLALTWLGESMEENEVEQALVKAIFSLESLIGKKNGNNIAESLSTNAAIILSDDYEGRMKVKRTVKQLYKIRSKVAHGELIACSQQQYLEACQIVRDIIFKFINDTEFNEFDKFIQVENKINSILYS